MREWCRETREKGEKEHEEVEGGLYRKVKDREDHKTGKAVKRWEPRRRKRKGRKGEGR